MFDLIPTHMVILAIVAMVLIGPKDLPRVMRFVGQWVGKGRTMARHFRTAMDDMIREAELQEMEQKWKAENERIMREHADMMASVTAPHVATPAPSLPAPDAEMRPLAAVSQGDSAPPPGDAPRQG